MSRAQALYERAFSPDVHRGACSMPYKNGVRDGLRLRVGKILGLPYRYRLGTKELGDWECGLHEAEQLWEQQDEPT